MLITRYDANSRLNDFKKGFDLLSSILDDLNPQNTQAVSVGDFSPTINTREGEFAYHIEVDLPGVKKDDIDIQVEDNAIVISGERKMKKEMKEENYYKIESSFGSFSRSFYLPDDVDVENIHAESTDGVLEVIIPKLESAKVDKVKKVEIK